MKCKDLISVIEKEFENRTVLVIGDLMVDQYITGSVSRISPEAPVPVLNHSMDRLEGGGACNVAHNLKTLGCNVCVAGVAADDEAGRWIRQYLEDMGIVTDCIIAEADRPTTLKTRYATKGQQLLRVDKEKTNEILGETEELILQYIKKHATTIDGVVMSDYRKGVLNSENFIKRIINLCSENEILTAIDSKSRNIYAFENANIVKPNNIELENAVGIKIADEDSLNSAGEEYLKRSGAKILLVTKGAKGISIFQKDKARIDYPAAEVQVYDVTGAGDTVISTVVMALLADMDIGEAVKLANMAAGIVISKVGTVAVEKDELIKIVSRDID